MPLPQCQHLHETRRLSECPLLLNSQRRSHRAPRMTESLCQSHQPYISGTAPASQAPEGSIHTWSCQLQQVRTFEDLEQCRGCLSHTSAHVCNVRPSRRWRDPRNHTPPTHPNPLAASTLAECHQRSQTWLEQVRCPYQLLQCPTQHQCGPQGCPRGNYQWLGGRGRDGQTSVSDVNSAASVASIPATRTAYSVGGLRVCAARDAPQVDSGISATS